MNTDIAIETDQLKHYPSLEKALENMPERFPMETAARHARLLSILDGFWGTRDAVDYLNGVLLPDRSDRQRFTPGVIAELVAIKELHEIQYPQFSYNGANDPFSTDAPLSTTVAQEKRKDESDKGKGSKADRRGLPKLAPIAPALGWAQEEEDRAATNEPARKEPAALVVKKRPDKARPSATRNHKQLVEPVTAAEVAAEAAARITEPPSHWPALHDISQLRDIVDKRRQGRIAPEKDPRKLLEILLAHRHVDEKSITSALEAHLNGGKKEPLGKFLQEVGAVSEEDITRALCLQNGIPIVDLRNFSIAIETMKKVPTNVARLKRTVPVAVIGNVLFLAVENPLIFGEREYFSFLTNCNVELVMAAGNQIAMRLAEYGQARNAKEADDEFRNLAQKALAPLAGAATVEEEEYSDGAISQEDASVVGLVNKMIIDAADNGASDIHIERFPGNRSVHIRVRYDGRLESYSEYPSTYHDAVVSRIKIISGLDITERRRPQDGKISFSRSGKERLDLRVATIPTLRGIENVVIRLLRGGDPLPITQVGMEERDLEIFRHLIQRPHGLILVSGPTGSGKTTTLHSALKELNSPDRKIWTAEDPVEIVQKNVNQLQVNAKIGLTFASALRAFLRADPDVIMIGEMRDQETAKIALEASMTGHLVLSTLHTNSSSETVARLFDLGVDPFNLADALLGVLAQRLTRQLCPKCKARHVLTHEEIEDLAAEFFFSAHQRQPADVEREAVIADWKRRFGRPALWSGEGCELCNGKGYKGRMAIFEVLEVTPEIRHLIRVQRGTGEILRAAIAGGMLTLRQDGIEKALAGKTDMTEVRGACS